MPSSKQVSKGVFGKTHVGWQKSLPCLWPLVRHSSEPVFECHRMKTTGRLSCTDGQAPLILLQTGNFRLFLRQQKDEQKTSVYTMSKR
jgi:hypothetical protein